jgi:hypothetical protein
MIRHAVAVASALLSPAALVTANCNQKAEASTNTKSFAALPDSSAVEVLNEELCHFCCAFVANKRK